MVALTVALMVALFVALTAAMNAAPRPHVGPTPRRAAPRMS